MTAMPRNPYVAGNPVGDSPAFVGRADVLRSVLRVLRHDQQNAIVLYGQRRIGKTSILQHLAARLPEEGPYSPVYFDLQDKAAWPLGRVLEELAGAIAHALGQPAPNLGAEPEATFRDEWLPGILNALPEGSAVVLLLDEFDVLADPEGTQAAKAFFPYLRGLLASDPGRLQFEFVIGRNIDDLDNIALSVFKGTPARRISLLKREDMAELVQMSETNGTLRWSADALERVWQWTHGHPFLTQQLCSHVWERAYDEALSGEALPNEAIPGEALAVMPVATPEAVDAAVPEALEASRNTMEWLWDGLPPAERVVASALAEAGSDAIEPDALERLLHDSGVRVVIRELQSAPQLLQDWDLIEPTDGGYRFRVELLRCWIAEQKPLRRVQEELDYIEPVAENLYQAALGLYQGNELEGAVDLLRRAIALNPNHVRANQLLADILLAQGDAKEATQLLERLFEYQPAAARPRLIQALLVMAGAETVEDEQLAIYERVLELAPAQPEAVGGLRQIWRHRGDAARELGDLDSALSAYRLAGAIDKASEVEDQIERHTLLVEIQAAEDAEGRGAYSQALELVHGLADRYPERRDWAIDVQRLERKTELKDLYQRGVGALESGDQETAQRLLAQVVALEPGYEEATRYLHRAVTGVDASSMLAVGQQRLDPLSAGLLSALTLVIWILAGAIGGYFWGKASLGDEFVIALAAGAIAALTSGLVLALAWHWRRTLHGLLAVGLAIGWGLMGAVVWGAGELLLGWRGPYVGAVVMGIASESVILWRQRGPRPRRGTEQPAAVEPKRRLRLSAWNPVDHVRLLWWVSAKPQTLKAIIADEGQDAVRKVGKWLVSTIVWLPILVVCLVVWSTYNFELEEVLLTGIGVLVSWLLSGWLGARGARWESWLAGAVGLGVAGAATVVLADAVWNHLVGWVAAAPVIVPGLALLLALGMVSGVALVLVQGVAGGTALGALVGVIAGLLFAALGGDLDAGWVVLCLTGGAVGLALTYLVTQFAGQGLRTGRPSWPARMLFPLLVLSYAAFAWLAVFDGWQYFG